MGNLADYKAVWSDTRKDIKRVRAEYDSTIAKLEPYKGSKHGDEQTAIADAKLAADLQAVRTKHGKRFEDVLHAMKKNLDERKEAVVPPNDEQLRIIQTLQLMTSITIKDYQRYAELMEGSDMAMAAFHDVASARLPEGVRLQPPKGRADRAWEQAKELSRQAKVLIRWDGCTTRSEALNSHLSESRGRGGTVVAGASSTMAAFDSAAAADLDPTAKDFYDGALGILLRDDKALQMLD